MVCFSYMVPIAIALLIFSKSTGILVIAKKLVQFSYLVPATMIASIIAALIFDLGPQGYIVYGMLTGTYIGGSEFSSSWKCTWVDSMFVGKCGRHSNMFFLMAFLAQAVSYRSLQTVSIIF